MDEGPMVMSHGPHHWWVDVQRLQREEGALPFQAMQECLVWGYRDGEGFLVPRDPLSDEADNYLEALGKAGKEYGDG